MIQGKGIKIEKEKEKEKERKIEGIAMVAWQVKILTRLEDLPLHLLLLLMVISMAMAINLLQS